MEEINYIDRLRLIAVDHPEGTEVYPNERFLSETPFATRECGRGLSRDATSGGSVG